MDKRKANNGRYIYRLCTQPRFILENIAVFMCLNQNGILSMLYICEDISLLLNILK